MRWSVWLRDEGPLVATSAALGLGVAAWRSTEVAVAWFVAARLGYVLFAGLTLRSRARAPEPGWRRAWRRFRRTASILMTHDALAFGALCLATRDGLQGLPWPVAVALGVVAVIVGFGVKRWAARCLPKGSYHWRDFFVSTGEAPQRAPEGPYRWLANPMYTLGYAQAYGFALLVRSDVGLVGAFFAQASILALPLVVERPHRERMHGASTRDAATSDAPPISRPSISRDPPPDSFPEAVRPLHVADATIHRRVPMQQRRRPGI